MNKLKEKQKGIVIIFSVFFISLILGSAFALSAIFIPKIRLSVDVKNSPTALYAADTGIEWCLYVNRQGTLDPLYPLMPIFNDTAISFIAEPADCSAFPLKTTGSYMGVSWSLEVNL